MKQILVTLDCIDPNPYQPASARDEEKVLEIAASIKQNFDDGVGTQGLNQVPTARKVGDRYQLAFGHHRHQAFVHLAGEGEAFAKMPLIIEDLSDQQMFEAMATENLQRREISFIEEAEMFDSYMTIFNKNSVETAQRFQKTEEHVRGRIMFLQLPDAAKEKAKAGELNVTTARALVSVRKVGGDEIVERALKETEKKHWDSPQEAIEHVLVNTQGITRLNISADWAQANKNFPHKHLPKITQSDLVSILDVRSDSESRKAGELLKVIYSGDEFSGEDFPEFSAENFLKLRTLLKPPACTKCPFHTSIDRSDYCGIELCMERKKEAWEHKKLEDVASNLGIPLYQKSDGKAIQLYPYNEADKKLFNEGHPDLRLAPASYQWTNFEGVGMDLKVVAVGETAEKRLKAEEKSQTKANDERVDYLEQRRLTNTIEQYALRFAWEVASMAFLPAFDGLTNLPILDCLLNDLMEFYVEDVEFPEGSDDHQELAEQARRMKKADGLKQMRRLMAYDLIHFKGWMRGDYVDWENKKPIVQLAKELQTLATEWGIKLPKDFMKQAEKYQTELDAAIKELKKPEAKKGK